MTAHRTYIRDLLEEGPCEHCSSPLYLGDLAYFDADLGRWYCSPACVLADTADVTADHPSKPA